MKIKTKGAYDAEKGWHQNHSALVVAKAVTAFYADGIPIEDFVFAQCRTNQYDFMLRAKVDRSSQLVMRTGVEDYKLPKTSRYYITEEGPQLIKIMNPKKRKVTLKMRADWKRAGLELTDEQVEAADEKMQKIERVEWEDLKFPSNVLKADNIGRVYDCIKDMQPKPREIAIDKGYNVQVCNDYIPDRHQLEETVNFDYYIDQAKKLLV